MGKMPSQYLWILVPLILCNYLSCTNYDNFEKIPSTKLSQQDFPNMRNVLNEALEEGFNITEKEREVILSYKGYSQSFDYPIYLSYIDEEYLVLLTGLRTFDVGWKYLVFPTYTRIVVLEKKTLDFLIDKTISGNVSKAKIKNDAIIFAYGEYPDLKYGRIPLDD